MKNKERVFKMTFASIYPHYITKAEKRVAPKKKLMK